eukprot:6994576-Heterocapsa_arctica.AAC.1
MDHCWYTFVSLWDHLQNTVGTLLGHFWTTVRALLKLTKHSWITYKTQLEHFETLHSSGRPGNHWVLGSGLQYVTLVVAVAFVFKSQGQQPAGRGSQAGAAGSQQAGAARQGQPGRGSSQAGAAGSQAGAARQGQVR